MSSSNMTDLHMAQLMPLPLTVSCFSIIQIGFTFLVPADPGSPGKRAVKRVCVCVFHHPSLFHSSLKLSFSANPSHRSLPFFFRTDYLDSPLFTVTSEYIPFLLFIFSVITLFSCCFRAVD